MIELEKSMKETGQKLIDDLPYVFDLIWDIKSRRRLYETLIDNLGEASSKLDSMCDTNITITEEEAQALSLVMEDLIETYKRYKGE